MMSIGGADNQVPDEAEQHSGAAHDLPNKVETATASRAVLALAAAVSIWGSSFVVTKQLLTRGRTAGDCAASFHRCAVVPGSLCPSKRISAPDEPSA